MDELEAIVRKMPLLQRLELSQSMIIEMCAKGRPPKMSIPASAHDEDIFICTTLRDAVIQLALASPIMLEADNKGRR